MPESLTLAMPRNLVDGLEAKSAPEPDEAKVIASARAGDAPAFAWLVKRHENRVFQLVGRFYRHPEDVDDVAQEVFIRAWSKLHTFRSEAPFEHWLTRLTLNLCYRRLRRQDPQTVSLDQVGHFSARSRRSSEAALEACQWLSRLDPRDRFILLLLDGEGWSTAEIAEKLGWSRVNVKVRAHRARKRLRSWLKEGES